MIFYLNKGLILEEEIVRQLKAYFSTIKLSKEYKNYTVNVTNEHPFDAVYGGTVSENEAASLFPAIIVTTYEDTKSDQLDELIETKSWALEKGMVDQIIPNGYDVIPEVVEEIRKEMGEREELYGTCFFIFRKDKISIEIWCENIKLKNELYKKVMLYVCGMMKHLLVARNDTINVFDHTIRGQRSNNFNYDFGISLAGGQITFDADYTLEQSVIDSEIRELKGNLLVEVCNHVTELGEKVRKWVIGPDDARDGDQPGICQCP